MNQTANSFLVGDRKNTPIVTLSSSGWMNMPYFLYETINFALNLGKQGYISMYGFVRNPQQNTLVVGEKADTSMFTCINIICSLLRIKYTTGGLMNIFFKIYVKKHFWW